MNFESITVQHTLNGLKVPGTRLHGRWLIVARVLWLALFFSALALFIGALPLHIAQLHVVCTNMICAGTQSPTEIARDRLLDPALPLMGYRFVDQPDVSLRNANGLTDSNICCQHFCSPAVFKHFHSAKFWNSTRWFDPGYRCAGRAATFPRSIHD